MFENITPRILLRMEQLEAQDKSDRTNGTPRLERLRQIPPETGKFLAILAAMSPPGRWIEIGTSAGYSTLWLCLAAMEKQNKINTFEILPEKIKLAKETFHKAGVDDFVQLYGEDLRNHPNLINNIAFCFLDCEKDIYEIFYDLIIPKLVPGGLLVADNAINHEKTLKPMLEKALQDPRVDVVIVPIGMGELVCRKR